MSSSLVQTAVESKKFQISQLQTFEGQVQDKAFKKAKAVMATERQKDDFMS